MKVEEKKKNKKEMLMTDKEAREYDKERKENSKIIIEISNKLKSL